MKTIKRSPRSTCEANVILNEIHADLKALGDKVNDWLGEHGDGCGCPYCSIQPSDEGDPKQTHGAIIEQDLSGIGWNLEMAASVVHGLMYPLYPEEIEALRALQAAAAADECDEPFAVVAVR